MRSFLFVLLFFIGLLPLSVHSQVSDATIDKWAVAMKSIDDLYGDRKITMDVEIWYNGYKNADTARMLLQRILKSPEADMNNKIFRFRVLLMRMVIFQGDEEKRSLAGLQPMADSLLLLAYQTAEERVIAWANWYYGGFHYVYQQLETAVTFCSRAVQKFDEGPSFVMLNSLHCVLGEIMFHAGEYRAAISNTLKGLPYIEEHNMYPYFFITKYYNTIGQAYQRLNMPDSALHYFDLSTRVSRNYGDSIWVSINALNIGEIYLGTARWQEAKALFLEAYHRNKGIDRAMEASAQLALGNWYLKNRQTDSAQWFLSACVQTSLQYRTADISLRMDNYRRRALDAILDLYVDMGKPQGYYEYKSMYQNLNDSLNKVTLSSSIKSVELRNKALNDEMAMAQLKKEKESEKWIRNLIIFIILSLSAAVIVYLNKQHRILKLEKQAEQLKQEAAEKELADARRQLAEFTQRLQEKSQLLDRLKEQTAVAANKDQYHEVVEELTRQTILTENDWQKFRNLFEKIEPAFFPKLRSSFPEITVAELRIAALTLLQIDNHQMAAMLGISTDSVRKSRQRLRQRLQLESDTNLHRFLLEI